MESLPIFAKLPKDAKTAVNNYTHEGGGLVGRYIYFLQHKAESLLDIMDIKIWAWALKNIIRPTMPVAASSVE